MTRRPFTVVRLGALALALALGGSAACGRTVTVTAEEKRAREKQALRAIRAELSALDAADVARLVDGSGPRALSARPLTGSGPGPGQVGYELVLEPGPPTALPVPTALDGLELIFDASGGDELELSTHPDREEIAKVVGFALEDEERAVAAALSAMERAHPSPFPSPAARRATITGVELRNRFRRSKDEPWRPKSWVFHFDAPMDGAAAELVEVDASTPATASAD